MSAIATKHWSKNGHEPVTKIDPDKVTVSVTKKRSLAKTVKRGLRAVRRFVSRKVTKVRMTLALWRESVTSRVERVGIRIGNWHGDKMVQNSTYAWFFNVLSMSTYVGGLSFIFASGIMLVMLPIVLIMTAIEGALTLALLPSFLLGYLILTLAVSVESFIRGFILSFALAGIMELLDAIAVGTFLDRRRSATA